MNISQSLTMATNVFGSLSDDLRVRVGAAAENPCEETWEDAYSIILNKDGFMTLWQAVLAVDPSFASAKGPRSRLVWDCPSCSTSHDEQTYFGTCGHCDGQTVLEPRSVQISGWSAVPSGEAIRQAVAFACH